MSSNHYNLIVIGAGLVGLSVAYHIKQRDLKVRVLLIEKEEGVARHQSGRNSGVIHSGIYYAPGSMKAQNCISGYHDIVRFAEEHQIPYELCGKIIVATSPPELPRLNMLYERGLANGLSGLKMICPDEITEMEPHCIGLQGIHVPQTGIIDYPRLAGKLLDIFRTFGGEVIFGQQVVSIKEDHGDVSVTTTDARFTADRIVSCAGLHSDRIASMTHADNDLRIIPFRGEYYTLRPAKENMVKNLIYPVPDPEFPFLGAHFTRMIHGGVEAGPNAVLGFKREGYRFCDLSFPDMYATLSWPGFWKIAAKYGKTGLGEIYRSLCKQAFVRQLKKLVPELEASDLVSGGAGVRAQACDRNGNLVDDFNILAERRVVHVRNAPSPAATSCLAIGRFICDRLTPNLR